jgi:hypothetical protein
VNEVIDGVVTGGITGGVKGAATITVMWAFRLFGLVISGGSVMVPVKVYISGI